MIRCLQKSVSTSMGSVQLFLNDATDILTKHPESIEDISIAKRKHDEFLQRRSEVRIVNLYVFLNTIYASEPILNKINRFAIT